MQRLEVRTGEGRFQSSLVLSVTFVTYEYIFSNMSHIDCGDNVKLICSYGELLIKISNIIMLFGSNVFQYHLALFYVKL